MLLAFGAVMGLWACAMVSEFGVERVLHGNPYFRWSDVTVAKQWELFVRHLRTTIVPMHLVDVITRDGWHTFLSRWPVDIDRQDALLRATTDVLLPTFPLVGTFALICSSVQRLRVFAGHTTRRVLHASREDWIAGMVIVLAGLLTLVFLEPAGLGMVQTSLAPMLVLGLAIAGPLANHLGKRTARALWVTSILQFILFRGLFLGFNTLTSGADPYNLEIKHSAGIRYTVEYSDAVLPLAAAVAGLSACALILLVRRETGASSQSPAMEP
jgi:hypothetical protein